MTESEIRNLYDKNEITLAEAIDKTFKLREAKYKKLLEFARNCLNQSCCIVCNCMKCDALEVLREIGEAN